MTITPAIKLTILKHLVNGRDKDFVAQAVGVSIDEVLDAASAHGYPDVDKMKWAVDILDKQTADAIPERTDHSIRPGGAPKSMTAPTSRIDLSTARTPAAPTKTGGAQGAPLSAADGLAQLIADGKASEKARTRRLAEKITSLVDELTDAVAKEATERAEREQAAREAAEKAKRIAELEAELAQLKGKPASRPTSPMTSAPAGQVPASQIRRWAAENGISCPAVGVIRKDVRDAYDAAHRSTAA